VHSFWLCGFSEAFSIDLTGFFGGPEQWHAKDELHTLGIDLISDEAGAFQSADCKST
jgi:hypothetical protein